MTGLGAREHTSAVRTLASILRDPPSSRYLPVGKQYSARKTKISKNLNRISVKYPYENGDSLVNYPKWERTQEHNSVVNSSAAAISRNRNGSRGLRASASTYPLTPAEAHGGIVRIQFSDRVCPLNVTRHGGQPLFDCSPKVRRLFDHCGQPPDHLAALQAHGMQ